MIRAEKYVYNYVSNRQLVRERRIQAVNVIKCSLKVWHMQCKGDITSTAYIQAQRRLIRSIHFNQRLKRQQTKLCHHCLGFPEITTRQRSIQMEQTLLQISQNMMNLQDLLLNKMAT